MYNSMNLKKFTNTKKLIDKSLYSILHNKIVYQKEKINWMEMDRDILKEKRFTLFGPKEFRRPYI